MNLLQIGSRRVGPGNPCYFIADISANHDGDIERAKSLIHLCAEFGADAAKFQNFRASEIVSARGFAGLRDNASHQAKWKKSVFEVYKNASLPWEWTEILKKECDKAGIDYFSSPYDFEAVDMLDPYVPAYKIGSGDLNWREMLLKMASKNKPVILATGASTMTEVQDAVRTILAVNPQLGLLQCNTNYTGSLENFKHIHLNVLKTYRVMFPDVVLGLSDHTPGHATVLGSVALGASLVEKHFTDDNTREGPDHPFSMLPSTWREMVDRTRELEFALGDSTKEVAANERSSSIVQRRCVRAARDLPLGTILTRELLSVLRPAPPNVVLPSQIDDVIGKILRRSVSEGEAMTWSMFDL